jgi:hypothetical protein
LRYAPPPALLSMTTNIYDDKVAFISSKTENYGVISRARNSPDCKSLFEGIRAISR